MDLRGENHALSTFYNEMSSFVGVRRACNVGYLDFSKAFSTVSRNIRTNELMMYRLDKYTMKWIANWLNSQARKGCDRGHKVQLEANH